MFRACALQYSRERLSEHGLGLRKLESQDGEPAAFRL